VRREVLERHQDRHVVIRHRVGEEELLEAGADFVRLHASGAMRHQPGERGDR